MLAVAAVEDMSRITRHCLIVEEVLAAQALEEMVVQYLDLMVSQLKVLMELDLVVEEHGQMEVLLMMEERVEME